MDANGTRSICKVCNKQFAKYTCPRCNVKYCSLHCYKAHSLRCTEGFYSELVAEQLHGDTVSDEQKQRMQEILQRVQAQQEADEAEQDTYGGAAGLLGEDSDSEGGQGLSKKTITKLLQRGQAGGDIEVNEADLSEADLQAFRRALTTGKVSHLLPTWEPWWLSQEAAEVQLSATGTPLIAQAREAGQPAGEAASQLPPAPSEPLPPLRTLTKAAPSPHLPPTLLEWLYAYCLTLRLYNGDIASDAQEVAVVALHLAPGLSSTATPSAAAQHADPSAAAAEAVAERSQAAAAILLECITRACAASVLGSGGRAAAVAVLQDVARLLYNGRANVILALSDLRRLTLVAQTAEKLQAGGDAHRTAGSAENAPEEVKPGSAGTTVAQTSRRARDATRPKGRGRDEPKSGSLKRQLVFAARKLLFYLSWAAEQPEQLYQQLAGIVGQELEHHMATLASPVQGGPVAMPSQLAADASNGSHAVAPARPLVNPMVAKPQAQPASSSRPMWDSNVRQQCH